MLLACQKSFICLSEDSRILMRSCAYENVLDNQNQYAIRYASVFSLTLFEASDVEAIMYIRSLISYILTPQARKCSLIIHLLPTPCNKM